MPETHTESRKRTWGRPDWSVIALEYFDAASSIRAIARRHNITECGIRKHAARHGWGARRQATTASGIVDELARSLTVRLAQIDGVGPRARHFVKAMLGLGAGRQEIAAALRISEASLAAEFETELRTVGE